MRRGPQQGAGRRVEIEEAPELAHTVLAGIALGHDPAFAGAQQPGKGRAAQIDDDIPAPGGDRTVERQPMQRPAPLFDDQHPLASGHRLEQWRRHRPGGDGQPRAGKALDQVGDETGRQHGVADARRGDKQDIHLGRSGSPHIPRPELAKLTRLAYV